MTHSDSDPRGVYNAALLGIQEANRRLERRTIAERLRLLLGHGGVAGRAPRVVGRRNANDVVDLGAAQRQSDQRSAGSR